MKYDIEQDARDIDSPDAFNWDILHPDLQPYVVETPRIGRIIKAPLIVDIAPIIPTVNRRYEAKRSLFEAYVAAGNIGGALAVIERPFRINQLLDWNTQKVITDAQLCAEFPATWSDAEPDDTDPGYLAVWERLARLAEREGVQLGDELPADAGDPLTIYRGQHSGFDRLGCAWSLDIDTAYRFAARFNPNEFGVVLRATLPRRSVLAYIADRHESEVVCNPHDLTETGWRPVTTLGGTPAADWRAPLTRHRRKRARA